MLNQKRIKGVMTMSYEIPREIFKQKLLDRTNLCLIQVLDANSNQEVPFKDVKTIHCPLNIEDFNKNFADKFEALEKSENKSLKKFLNTEAGSLISNFLNNEN